MRPFRTPNRRTDGAGDGPISQTYNNGIAVIYTVSDAAQPGHQPVKKYDMLYTVLFAERAVGVTRYYQAQQAQKEISRVIRIPFVPKIDTRCECRIDGELYRIDQVQKVIGTYPESIDLTLIRYESKEQRGRRYGCECDIDVE